MAVLVSGLRGITGVLQGVTGGAQEAIVFIPLSCQPSKMAVSTMIENGKEASEISGAEVAHSLYTSGG
ncbi:hypothetical protein AFK62_16375 [Cronobacter condimenti 1330]|uniref:Uncharacterized protein n=1 Tax=Cronobacter condimenti 1330 TaxID=1073999 RepID=A0ABM5VFP8_9ENTR|nr:hypothetical protein AFK62_16375 [Cronobacter condimenti 1330]